MREDVHFTPRYLTVECEICPDDIKKTNCVSDGKYCLVAPPNYHQVNIMINNLSDADLLIENIREKCIFKLVEEKHKENMHDFFKYLDSVHEDCLSQGKFSHTCTNKHLKHVKQMSKKV